MDVAGKTVARIEVGPASHDGPQDDIVLVHFTDGTALSVRGSSYEEVGQSVCLLASDEVRRSQRAAMGWRERERLRRLRRAEWLAASCEERGRRRSEERARMHPLERGIRDDFERMGNLITPTRYRMLCEVCHEPACENTRIVPATLDLSSRTMIV